MSWRHTLIAAVLVAGCGSELEPVDVASEADSAMSAGLSNWQPMLTCDNGAATLDVNLDERRNLQFVIRDPGIIGYFNQVGAAHSPYGANALVLSGYSAHVDWGNPRGPGVVDYPYNGKGVFQASDFQELIADFNYYYGHAGTPFARVFRNGNGLKVQYATISGGDNCLKTDGMDCSGNVDGYPCVPICVEWSQRQFQEKANWVFQDCH